MSVHHRLILLIFLVITGAVGCVFVIGWFQKRTIAHIYAERHRTQTQATAQIVALHSEPLVAYVTDYTIWDDMLRFAQTCDESWADANIAATITTFRADAAWVFRQDGRLCYATDPSINLTPAILGQGMSTPTEGTTIHTFQALDATVWDVVAATIHPTDDQSRTTSPQGWFIVARRLDATALTEISTLLDSQVSLALGDTSQPVAADQESDTIRTRYPLLDVRGVPVATLIVTSTHHLVHEIKQFTTEMFILIVTVNLVIFGLLSLGLSRWVDVPLRILTRSLQQEQPAALNRLVQKRGEFGLLAHLIQDFFAQHQLLIQEVTARQQAEAALRSFFDNTGLMMGIVELHANDILHIADNAATAAFFDTTVEAMRGQYASMLGVPPQILQRWLSACRQSSQHGQPVQFEYAHERSSTRAWLSATVSCIGQVDDGQIRYSYVVMDMTERQAIESQLRMSQQQLEAVNAQLRQLAQTDGLTGLHNRTMFDECLAEAITHTTHDRTPVSLLLIDIDYFKHYNDTYGHVAGDDVLRAVAGIFREQARRNDLAARYGGEEFAIILPNTREQDAMLVAERIRRSVEQMPWPERAITISIGVATVYQPVTTPHFIALADGALYRAKAQGRNCVVHAYQVALRTGNPCADETDARATA